MSFYFKTVPKNIALSLMDKYNLNIFVETGTYVGKTSAWAAEHFSRVYTVEFNKDYYDIAINFLCNLKNVSVKMNDSRIFLKEMLPIMAQERALIYLDAHWSVGAIYGRPKSDTVVIEEIEILNNLYATHAIIVDDSHKFGGERWPTKEEVITALENNGNRSVKELLGVLIAVMEK